MDKQADLLAQLRALTAILSPTGMTGAIESYVMNELQGMGFAPVRERKGTIRCEIGGTGRGIAIAAHLDTLGAVVRAVKPNGCLRYAPLGGFNHSAIENENVLIHTRTGKTFTGTVQCVKASRHVWGLTDSIERSDETLEIVPDVPAWSAEETKGFGISAGDFISFDPRTVFTETGFIKSRFLDDKAAAAVLLTLARLVACGELKPARRTVLIFTVYEETGPGAATIAALDGIEDLLAVDMGCVGSDLNGREDKVSICAKDAAGPYDFTFTNELIARAQRLSLHYAVDVYHRYSSDTATALDAGLDARFALCGPGVFASHAYERTHVQGLLDTLALVADVTETAQI